MENSTILKGFILFSCMTISILQGRDHGLTPFKIGKEPLHKAVLADDLEKAKELVEHNPNLLFVKDERSRIPLHYVNKLNMAQLLVGGCPKDQQKKLLNDQDGMGWTPLIFALISDEREICKYLIECDADVFHIDLEGRPTLRFVQSKAAIQLLVDAITTKENGKSKLIGLINGYLKNVYERQLDKDQQKSVLINCLKDILASFENSDNSSTESSHSSDEKKDEKKAN